jgi:regulatory protein
MEITAITSQARDQNRVNVSVDGKYSFSLEIAQISELGVKVGQEISADQLAELKEASARGKLYARALEYCLSRPHSQREIKDYLRRKTLDKKYKPRGASELKLKKGFSPAVADDVLRRLTERGYVNDQAFAKFWVENHGLSRGMSQRRLKAELAKKGVPQDIASEALAAAPRDDQSELKKVIAKKANKYEDKQKLMAYLARQGFSLDDIKEAFRTYETD